MLAILTVTFIGGYALVASWAVRRSRSALLLSAVVAALFLVAAATFLGFWHTVPSMLRLTMYILGFVGPVIVVPTALLWRRTTNALPSTGSFPIALVGAGLGLVLGYFIVVFGFGTW